VQRNATEDGSSQHWHLKDGSMGGREHAANGSNAVKRHKSAAYSRLARVDGLKYARTLLVRFQSHATELDKVSSESIASVGAGRENPGMPSIVR
jgi:hypothetical protein